MSAANLNSQDKPRSIDEYIKRADYVVDQRFLHFAFSCLGKSVEVQLEDGSKTQGKFYTANIDNGDIVLKNCFREGDSKKSNGTKILAKEDFVYILAPNIEEPPLLQGNKSVFKTDAEISTQKVDDHRTFVKWNDDADTFGGSLEEGASLEDFAKGKEKWNQFELNEKKFGLQSNWDEGRYTTQLDMKNVSKKDLERAARIEAEILSSSNDYGNRHIREERGLEGLKEENEEFAYSSVIRTEAPLSKKKDTPIPEDRIPKFTNSKRTASNPSAASSSTTTTETKSLQQTLEGPNKAAVFGNKKEEGLSATMKTTELGLPRIPLQEESRKSLTNTLDKTPKLADPVLSHQSSSQSTDASKLRPRLSKTAVPFGPKSEVEETTPKVQAQVPEKVQVQKEEEAKVTTPSAKQDPAPIEPVKTFNIQDYNSTAISKFKLKLKEDTVKKSSVSFYDFAIPNFYQNTNVQKPMAIDQSWSASKAASKNFSQAKGTFSSQLASKSSTANPLRSSQPFRPNIPTAFPSVPMVNPVQMGQPMMDPMMMQTHMGYGNPGYYPSYNPSPYMYPQTNPSYYHQAQIVDPTQPGFNFGYSQGPKQGGQPYNKNLRNPKS